jgi:CheY-like chemotaxis protein
MDPALHILLIDDDPDDREIFVWTMKNIHPTSVVDEAADGLDALDKLKDETYTPDVIFLDLNMPRMHGLECLHHIRLIRRLASHPVIVLSTSSNPHDIAQCLAAGATDYIVKANEISAIKKELSQVLGKYNVRLSANEYDK